MTGILFRPFSLAATFAWALPHAAIKLRPKSAIGAREKKAVRLGDQRNTACITLFHSVGELGILSIAGKCKPRASLFDQCRLPKSLK